MTDPQEPQVNRFEMVITVEAEVIKAPSVDEAEEEVEQ